MFEQTADRQSRIEITGGETRITLKTGLGFSNCKLTGNVLAGGQGAQRINLAMGPALAEAVAAAMAEARPATWESVSGDKVAASVAAGQSRKEDWGFSHVVNDAVGLYTRTITPATEPVTVWFGSADILGMSR